MPVRPHCGILDFGRHSCLESRLSGGGTQARAGFHKGQPALPYPIASPLIVPFPDENSSLSIPSRCNSETYSFPIGSFFS